MRVIRSADGKYERRQPRLARISLFWDNPKNDMANRENSVAVEPSTGNVFADLSLRDGVELDTKVRLAIEIVRALDDRQLSQAAAAKVLGINQPKVSAVRRYKLEGFSVERLMTFLTALGRDVEIRVTAPRKTASPGRILVEAT